MRDRNDNQWAIEAIRIAPAEHRSGLAIIIVLAIIALFFAAAFAGGATGAHHHGEE
jgi:predicted lysophospholipase L1 biosynthesis ABC-type transport system permease subunit